MAGIGFPFRDRAKAVSATGGGGGVQLLDRLFAMWVALDETAIQGGFDASGRVFDWKPTTTSTPLRVISSPITGIVAAIDPSGLTTSLGIKSDGTTAWSVAPGSFPAAYAWSNTSDYYGRHENMGFTESKLFRLDGASFTEVLHLTAPLEFDGWSMNLGAVLDYVISSDGQRGAAVGAASKTGEDDSWVVIGADLSTGTPNWVLVLGTEPDVSGLTAMRRLHDTDDLIVVGAWDGALRAARLESDDALATQPEVMWESLIETGTPPEGSGYVNDFGYSDEYLYIAHAKLANGDDVTALRLSNLWGGARAWGYAAGEDIEVTGVDTDGKSVVITTTSPSGIGAN